MPMEQPLSKELKPLMLAMLYIGDKGKPTQEQMEKYAKQEGFFELSEEQLDLRIAMRKTVLLDGYV